MWHWMQPDLVITVRPDQAPLPDDVQTWVNALLLRLRELPEIDNDGYIDRSRYKDLLSLKRSPPLDLSLHRPWSGSRGVRIDIVNTTKRAIPGLRLNLNEAIPEDYQVLLF
jgi:hypothetical protein